MFCHNLTCIFVFGQFYLSRSDAERFDREENEDVQREILARHGRNLPVQCRTHSGGTNTKLTQYPTGSAYNEAVIC